MSSGLLVVIEGLDRAGKSTQCSMLAKSLKSSGYSVSELKFPDRTTEIGKMINSFLTSSQNNLNDESIHLLFSANRWELAPKMEKLLAEGSILVVDRYTYSGTAFSAAKGLDIEWCKQPDVGLPKADVVIFLDVDEETASKRGGYGEERYESREMQRVVRTQFLKLKEPSWSWIMADKEPEAVFKEVDGVVRAALQSKSLKN